MLGSLSISKVSCPPVLFRLVLCWKAASFQVLRSQIFLPNCGTLDTRSKNNVHVIAIKCIEDSDTTDSFPSQKPGEMMVNRERVASVSSILSL